MKNSPPTSNFIKSIFTLLFVLSIQLIYSQDFRVLVYHETNGFRHTGAINASISMLEELGSNSDHDTWSVDDTRDASDFTTNNLSNYDVIVFSNTTGGDLLNNNQQASMEGFIQNGGGFVGFHSATDTYRNTNASSSWPWYNELVGAIVQASPNHTRNNLSGTMNVLNDHPVVDHIGNVGDTWDHEEEWYYWELNGGQLSDTNENLLEVESTGNQSYDATRPITWLKEFDGGRSFYTALGHNGETYEDNAPFREMVEKAILWTASRLDGDATIPVGPVNVDCGDNLTSSWTDLLENDLECWEIWMGVPHSTTGLPGASNNVTNGSGTPLGLENDPTNVFSVIEENGEKQLYITGEVYGGLTTLNEYSDYHLSMEFKWGETKWEPRLDQLRDSGILYHCQGEHGSFWDVWQSSLEFQVQEGDLGDYIGLAGARGFIPTNASGNTFMPRGELNTGGTIRAGSNPEFPNGEWNLLEVITIGDRAIHYVNGVMVNALVNATWRGDTLNNGQIQIQSEGAELYYRNIRIRAEDEFPSDDLATLGWDGSETETETTRTATGPDSCDEEAPIGSTIAFRKSGGDERWVTIDSATNNLIANSDEDSRAEFLVEQHPNGCIALKSITTNLYVQVVGSSDSSSAIRASGNAPGTWENFAWEQVGNNQVGLWSEFSNIWVQARWNQNNTSLFPLGSARGTWETFDFEIIDEVEEPEPETETETSVSNIVHLTKRNAPDFAIGSSNGGQNGQNIFLSDADENNINQQWVEIDRGNGFYSYQKQGTNFCIDGDRGGENRQNVYVWECAINNFNQHWQKVDVGGGAYQLVKRNATGFAIDGGSRGRNDQNVALYDSSNSSQNLHWLITPVNISAKLINDASDQIILFPNPVETTVTIQEAADSVMTIYDMNGRVLDSRTISKQDEIIDLSTLQSGLYYARIQTLDGVYVKEILKK